MIQCYSNSLVICLLVICLGVGACSEPQDVAGSCKGDLEETTNANTHLLANKGIAKEVQEWILKLGKGTAVLGAWGDATRQIAYVEWEKGSGYFEAKSDSNEKFVLKLPNLIRGHTLAMVCIPTEQ